MGAERNIAPRDCRNPVKTLAGSRPRAGASIGGGRSPAARAPEVVEPRQQRFEPQLEAAVVDLGAVRRSQSRGKARVIDGGGQLSRLGAKFAASNPGQVAGDYPVLLVQGTDDDTIPADLTQYLHSQLCAFEQPVELMEYPGAGQSMCWRPRRAT